MDYTHPPAIMPNALSFHNRLIDNLARSHRERGEKVEIIQTHISTVLLIGAFAYKLKKPLNLGFLDFSTLEQRCFCCKEEVRLNARLAPDIYLGTVAINGPVDAPKIDGKTTSPIEYAVKMRRFIQAGLLADHVELLGGELIDSIAQRLAEFHAGIDRSTPTLGYGTPQKLFLPMQGNFFHIRKLGVGDVFSLSLGRLECWSRKQHQALLAVETSRMETGFIRECHGDLHLGNIAVDDGRLIIFDGIEFNPQLRWIDTISELAFLSMDLDKKGRPELAQRLLNGYLELTGDYEGLRLLRFYQVYRAMIRAKVIAIRLQQDDLPACQYEHLHLELMAYLALAESYTVAGTPALLITHGLSGSGKSHGTGELIQKLPAVRIRSDVERKRLVSQAGCSDLGSKPLEGGYYTRAFSEKTYHRLLELAGVLLEAGFTVVVDATFLSLVHRTRFQQLAAGRGIPFLILEFQAPVNVMRKRIRHRFRQGQDASDADLQVLEAQIGACQPLTAAEQTRAIRFTPGHTPEVGAVLKKLDTELATK
ncbi:MAG: AAA family ATPase [Gammaproteobacteria bacterium]|nr:AAA family ATPase [Gammaproteobacteria bacterium]